jgi:Tfp pilus assembly protein PilN
MDKTDFLPERIRVQRARRRRLMRQGCLLGVCAIALATLTYLRHERITVARGELALLDDRVASVKNRLVLRSSLEQQMADLMVKKRIVDHLGSRAGARDVMAGLDQLVPESVALTSLDIETMEIRVPTRRPDEPGAGARATPAGAPGANEKVEKRVRMVLTGLAPTDVDLANFIGQLSACPLFEDVNMGYAKNVEFRGRAARQFLVSCYVVR